jgi:hypothetical protein
LELDGAGIQIGAWTAMTTTYGRTLRRRLVFAESRGGEILFTT